MSTFQQERSGAHAAHLATAALVADELGEGWTAHPYTDIDGEVLFHGFYLTGPAVSLFVSPDNYRHPGRWEIMGDIPKGTKHPRGDRPKITVDPNRDPVKLAADITRRLLPVAVDYWNQAQQNLDDEQTTATSQARSMAVLAEHGATPHGDRSPERFSIPGNGYGYGSLSHDGSSVNLDLHGISVAVAARILDVLTDWVTP